MGMSNCRHFLTKYEIHVDVFEGLSFPYQRWLKMAQQWSKTAKAAPTWKGLSPFGPGYTKKWFFYFLIYCFDEKYFLVKSVFSTALVGRDFWENTLDTWFENFRIFNQLTTPFFTWDSFPKCTPNLATKRCLQAPFGGQNWALAGHDSQAGHLLRPCGGRE